MNLEELFEEILDRYSEPVHDLTVDDKCSNCGNCCSNHLPISKAEIKEIRKYIKTYKIKEQKRFVPSATPMIDMFCPFRNHTTRKCEIYPVRPKCCRLFLCNKTKAEMWQGIKEEQYQLTFMRETFYGV